MPVAHVIHGSLFIRNSVTLPGEIPTAAVATEVVDFMGEEGY